MKSGPRLFFLCLLMIIVWCAFNVPGGTKPVPRDVYSVKYILKKGQSYSYESLRESEQLVEFMGSEQKMSSRVSTKFEISGQGANPAGNLLYTLTVSSYELELSNPLVDSTIKNPPELLDIKLLKEMKENGDQVRTVPLKVEKLSGLVAQSFDVNTNYLPNLPSGPLEIGKSVRSTYLDTISSTGRTIITNTEMDYVLEGEENKFGYDCLRIRYEGLVNAEGEGSLQGVQFSMEGDGDVEGLLHFAPKEGIVVSDVRTQTLELTARISKPQAMTLPITQTEKRSLTLVQ